MVRTARRLLHSLPGSTGSRGKTYRHLGAAEQMLLLVKQMAEREGFTEELKAQDQMLWVQRMKNIRDRATELVNHELIYV